MSKMWVTPKLMELSSGAEAQAQKGQNFVEGPGNSCGPGVGCPGTPELVGPS